MNRERWQRIKAVYAQASERPPAERAAFLDAECKDDADLIRVVRTLLDAAERPGPLDALGEAWVSPLLRRIQAEPTAPGRAGPYELVEEIGRGGMGVVYRAHDPRLGRDLAVKLLLPSLDARPEANARFLAEARAASMLDHPNVCTIYEADQTEAGQLFVAMPIYEGRTLREMLRSGPLPIQDCRSVALQVAEGLRCAHDAGIVHRDVKPSNLIVTAEGTVKLLDFGVARTAQQTGLTQTGARIGTVAYMAPEQVRGEAVDARADLWSLGVVLYEMLAGRQPFRGENEQTVLHAILTRDPEPLAGQRPDVSGPLDQVVRRALARAPADRFADATEMIAALRRAETGRAVPAVRRGLPAPATSLIGRDEEVGRAVALLGSARLLTLTGAGGIGKTRLALEVARQSASRFPDGVAIVDLAPITQPALVAPAIALALALPEAGGRSSMDSLKDALEHARMLLVLDNFEQVISASPLVAELLAACPALRILVASRTALRLGAEQELPVPPLAVAGGATRGDVVSPPPAAQLFVDRVRAFRPDFELTSADERAVTDLCARLDGLPLAIELAAARTKLFSPAQLLERLEGRIDVLGGGARDRPARHRTLEQTIAWSYDLLDEPSRCGFRRLSVFTGGFTIEAAESMLADDGAGADDGGFHIDAVELLARLLDHSLLQRSDEVTPRFVMLETIRTYALGRLEQEGEADAARYRHLRYFLGFVERAEPRLTGPDQADAFDRLEAEHDNLRAAIRFAETRGDLDTALRIGVAVWRFWLVRGNATEGRGLLRRLLEQPGRRVSTRLQARAVHGLATLLQHRGANGEARRLLEENLGGLRTEDERSALAAALNLLGWIACEQSDLAAAHDYSREALELCRRLEDRRGTAVALNNLGWVAFYRGDAHDAAAHHADSLALRRSLDDPRGIAFGLTNLAAARRIRGDYTDALAILEEAQTILEAVADRVLLAWARTCEGEVRHAQGDMKAAKALLEDVLPLWREVAARPGLAHGLTALADAALAAGETRRAEKLLYEAIGLWRAIGNRWGTAWALDLQGCVLRSEGATDAARERFEESLARRREIRDRRGQAETLESLASLEATLGRFGAAKAFLRTARDLRTAARSPASYRRRAEIDRLIGELPG